MLGHEGVVELHPHQQAVGPADLDLLAAEVVAYLRGVDVEPMVATGFESLRDARRLHEPIVDEDPEEALSQTDDLHPIRRVDGGNMRICETHRDEEDSLVQDLVVLEVMQQHQRDLLALGRHEDRDALHPMRLLRTHVIQEGLHGESGCEHVLCVTDADALPHVERGEHDARDRERDPAPILDLDDVGREVREVHREEDAHEHDALPASPPPRPRDLVEQHGSDGHGSDDRDPVGRGELARLLEDHDQEDRTDHDGPVDLSDVDLPLGGAGGVVDGDARAVAELNRLLRDTERAGDHRLRGHHGGDRRDHDHAVGEEHVPTDEGEERVPAYRVSLLDQDGALAEVVDEERGEHDGVPRPADGRATEVTHVGEESLAAGDAEDHRPQEQEAVHAVALEEPNGVDGVDGTQDLRVADDGRQPEGRDAHEPDERCGTEDGPDLRRSLLLEEEKPEQDPDGDRNDVPVDGGRHHFETLDGREHRDSRGDRPVTVEQGHASHAEENHRGPDPRLDRRLVDLGEEGRLPTLTVMVGEEDECRVLDDDHRDQRPDDQRQDAEHVGERRLDTVRPTREALLDRVQGRGAQVAEDHSHRPKGELRQLHAGSGGMIMSTRGAPPMFCVCTQSLSFCLSDSSDVSNRR